MRAIESGRKVVSVITGGGSSIVDINGDVLFEKKDFFFTNCSDLAI